ncbi:histone deacetylase family protein [Asticcacaulis sp. ZE23SCel15]|uniref:histone deacetylase family protein n=1 Tax=Asticcacaulis sp. ZE23SCel15 TaxID=3059027 RepID=UPI00265E91BA|nr:histone deacetylase family protein [Asticcacaulis sp. ZE23SCel15]WKL57615.1 histone deacetylase family protein [Asticcacaulis sp. ZE23SCel15]
MICIHSPASTGQNPHSFFRHGNLRDHPETSERYRILLAALAGHEIIEAHDHGTEPIKAVHSPDYVEFLMTAWGRRQELAGITDQLVATQFPRVGMNARPTGLQGQLGYYLGDTSTSIRDDTWSAIAGSAHAAVDAADYALKAGKAYALCRPPGHHAYAGYGSGFCYLNNAAIAAQRLRDAGAKVAVLDIDVHHGNGTQGIFYGRDDVLTVSVHAETSAYFPFYSGYANETGTNAGEGFNINLALEHGLGDEPWLAAIAKGLEAISAYGATALVVSLGLDASEHDPIGVLKVTTNGFERAGALIASAALPMAIIQEGGYICDALPHNLAAFLNGVD